MCRRRLRLPAPLPSVPRVTAKPIPVFAIRFAASQLQPKLYLSASTAFSDLAAENYPSIPLVEQHRDELGSIMWAS